MLTLLTAAAVLAACDGLRCFLNRPERKDAFFWGGRIFLGRTHPIDGPVE